MTFLNGSFNTKVSAVDTGGALCVIDTVRTGRGGPPLHLHHEQDELFFVQEGEFRFQIGADNFELGPGDFIFGPRRVPHAFVNLSENGRLLIAFQPAGTMEAFFSAGLRDPRSEEFIALSREHGMEVVGPPLTF
ncbi:MAG: cupin domain-containing protein [Cypionkella sp.]